MVYCVIAESMLQGGRYRRGWITAIVPFRKIDRLRSKLAILAPNPKSISGTELLAAYLGSRLGPSIVLIANMRHDSGWSLIYFLWQMSESLFYNKVTIFVAHLNRPASPTRPPLMPCTVINKCIIIRWKPFMGGCHRRMAHVPITHNAHYWN